MSIVKPINYFYQYYIAPGYVRKKYIFPTHINFPITDNCNSKCQMCNVWVDKSENELSPLEIQKIFSDVLFKKVQHFGISGGEPTLRKDLLECIQVILESLPGLKSLSITSHGFHPTKWEKLLPEIIGLCKVRKVFFKLNISVDGIGELHEEVRRIEGGWKKVLKTIKVAKKNNCPLQLQCTVSKHNVFGVNEVLHFARTNNIELIFRKATSINRLYNSNITEEFFTSNPEDSFFSDFLRSDILLKETKNPGRRLIYKEIAQRLTEGTNRKAPCHFQNNGVLISAHGEMFHCSIDEKPLGNCRVTSPYEIYFSENSRNQLSDLLNTICPQCIHDQSGSWNPFLIIKDTLFAKFKSIRSVLNYLDFGRKNIACLLGLYKRKLIIDVTENNHKSLHIIGAYGGEHVGDSAILGGVILRQINKYKDLKKIIVYSKRPDRTLFWVKGLDFDPEISIIVKDYKSLNEISISKNDSLAWAGGPIMEMPVDLFEHYVTIKDFTSKKVKFEIIGCGWGPFKTFYSKTMAKKILAKASYIQMRDTYDLPFNYELAKDPAFDYLQGKATKETEWNWNSHKSKEFIDKIKNKGYSKLMLLNVRPIWSKYNKSDVSIDELHSRLKNSIMKVIKNLPEGTAIISVPFNTDHYGFSDMDLAMEINDECSNGNLDNYFLFNRELNVRDMTSFLINFDYAICMRFHACIFLKSLEIPVYGIDYTAGETGKVGGLFKSFNDPNYSNILEIDTEQINSFIIKHQN